MSNKILFKNLKFNSMPTNKNIKKFYGKNSKNNTTKQTEKLRSPPNTFNINKNKNNNIANELINSKNNKVRIKTNSKYSNSNSYANNLLNKKKNVFISISDFPQNEEENMYDKYNYIKIIENSIIESHDNNPDKIKSVDANKYLNYENNSLSTFNDLKMKLLNKNIKFHSPFIFYKNTIDLTNPKNIENEKNYQIKRYRYLTSFKYSFNPVIRRKNSKIIQKWWRTKINPKIDKRKKIIKIQSVMRGYMTRKYLNEIICISVIYQNFINKLRHALGNFVHRKYFPKRYYKKKYALEKIFPLKLKLFCRKWKTIKDNLIKLDLTKQKKLRNILNNKMKKVEKFNYGGLKKSLYKWYLISKLINKENYKQFLMNIKTSIKKINSVITPKFLKNSYNKIKSAKVNEKNRILQKLKKYFIENDRINLYRAFHRFLKNTRNFNKKILISNIIYHLKDKIKEIRNKIHLTKYLNKWKMINKFNKSKRNMNTTLIVNVIRKIMTRILEKKFIKKLKRIKYKNDMDYLSKKLFEMYKKVEKRKLAKILKRWKNNAKQLKLFSERKEKGYTIIYNTLTKAYSYKKFEEVIIPLLINSFKKRYGKIFLEKYKKYFLAKINCSYKVSLRNNKKAKMYNFKFKKSIKPNYPNNSDAKNEEEIKNESNEKSNEKFRPVRYIIPKYRRKINLEKSNKKEVKNIIVQNTDNKKNNIFYYIRLIPLLFNYLNELRLKRLRFIFKYFKYLEKNNLFCKLLKSWTIKQNYYFKQNLIKAVFNAEIRHKLYLLMRKYIIFKLATKYFPIINRRNNLLILSHKIKVYKRINRKKKTIRFIRIWRLYVKFLRDRAAQLEKFEKSFSETYEKLSDSIFVDNGDEKSVQTQIMCFLDKIGHDEKKKLKNNLGISQSSLNSYLSGKNINNDVLNSGISNFTFHNDNESNISISRYSNYNYNNNLNKSLNLNNSNNNSARNIKSSVFNRVNKKIANNF